MIANKFVCFNSGGYEIIYDYLHHILGVPGKFSGVPMHVGHSFGHLHTTSGSKLGWNHLNYQRFLQSGVANWMASHTRVVPCCELDIVGGDGTAIGIPISNLKGMSPVWQPKEDTDLQVPHDNEFENKRMGRIPVAFEGVAKIDAQNARRKIRDLLTEGISQKLSDQYWDEYHEQYRHWLPTEFNEALLFWAGLATNTPLKRHLRSLLRDCISECSATTLVPKQLIDPLKLLCEDVVKIGSNRSACLLRIKTLFPEFDAGVLKPLYNTLNSCGDSVEAQIVVGVISIVSELNSWVFALCLNDKKMSKLCQLIIFISALNSLCFFL